MTSTNFTLFFLILLLKPGNNPYFAQFILANVLIISNDFSPSFLGKIIYKIETELQSSEFRQLLIKNMTEMMRL